MRLVYIYIDFTIDGKNPDGYRNYKKCGLNFGTEYYFKMSEPSEDQPNYELKCSAKKTKRNLSNCQDYISHLQYDEDTQKWTPPDYLTAETQKRWMWDQDKQIWIDLQKTPKKQPNPNNPVKLAKNGQSYEEWKNQHYKEIYDKLTEEAEKRQQEKDNPRE